MAIEARGGRQAFTDLGAGNYPTFSSDDRRIAFLLPPGAERGAEDGVWAMADDGSGRRRLGGFGAPFWSPVGREFLISSFSLPTASTVINLETKQGGEVEVKGRRILSWPSWAGSGTLISALAKDGEGESIVVLDVRKPGVARIVEVLWKRSKDLDVTPRWPVYEPRTRRCFFIGEEPRKRSLYSLRRGESLRATPMGIVEHQRQARNQQFGGLSFSPDGRYILFEANRPERE